MRRTDTAGTRGGGRGVRLKRGGYDAGRMWAERERDKEVCPEKDRLGNRAGALGVLLGGSLEGHG